MNRKPLFLAIGLFAFSLGVNSQGVTPTKGKEFWLGFMKNYEVETWESLDLFIVSDQNTSGTVTVPGQSWSQSFTITANTTTTVTVPNNIAEVLTNQVIENRGVLVETEDTVAVFAINFNGYTADGTKILPTQTLGTEYRISAYQGLDSFYNYNSEFLVVATEDDTEIEITLSGATLGGDAAGDVIVVQLDEGECYQVRGATYTDDFTGTYIRGTDASGGCRPFAVFSGSDCTNIPYGCFACDHIVEQNFPVEAWGTDYYVVPFDGPTVYTYRILANENGTSVSIDGVPTLVLNAGQWEEYNDVSGAHCIEANRPISVIQYMQGIGCASWGDPAMLILNDENQKIDNITFSTVDSDVITEHYVNLIIETADIGLVTLDGVVIAATEFQAFDACASHSYASILITTGSHTLDASAGSGVTAYVYGAGSAESYAYSVGSFSPLPPILIDDAICTNEQVILEISASYYDPIWYNVTAPEDTLGTDYQYVIDPPIVNGIYVGVGNDFVSGCEELFYFSVEVPEPPLLNTSQSATEICQFQSVQLMAQGLPESATYVYTWTPETGLSDPNIPNPVATPLVTTTYEVLVSTPTGCASNVASFTIEVEDGGITDFYALPEEALFCEGDEVQLEAYTETELMFDDFDPGISWGLWCAINNGAASATCGSVSGNALYFDGAGARSATTNALNVVNGGHVYFSLKVATGVAPCDNAEPGDNIVLSYSTTGCSGAFTPIQTYFESVYPEFLQVTAAIPAGAMTTATHFRWEQIGTFGAGQDNWILDDVYVGEENTLSFDYAWSPGAGLNQDDIANPVAGPSATTMYYVEMTDDLTGCTYTDSVFVNVGEPFDLTMTNDTTLCDVQGIQLMAEPSIAGEFDWLWTPATSISSTFSPTPTVTPTTTTTYSVTVTSEQGCTAEGDVQIIINGLLDLQVTATDQSICAGEVIGLNAEITGDISGIDFTWSPDTWIADANDPTTTAQPFDNITYVMTAVDEESGCTLVDELAISVLQVFSIEASPSDTAACDVEGIALVAVADTNAPLDWSWSPPGLVDNPNLPSTTFSGSASAELIVTAINDAGCGAQATVSITLIVEDTDLGPDVSFCEDETITLDTGWPDTYTFEWSTGDTTPSIEISEDGLVTVDVTSPLGCTSYDEVMLNEFTYPVVDLGPDTALCFGDSYLLNAGSPTLNHSWNTGDTGQFLTVTASGFYEVSVDNDYCFSSDDVSVVFNPLPINNLYLDTVICFGLPPYTLLLDAGNEGSTYLWNDNSGEQTYEVTMPGLYTVLVTTPFGCSDLFSMVVAEQCEGVIYVPNCFTPDGDGINDVFLAQGENIESFKMQIWNRWGELFFESNDIKQPWLGERRNDGEHYVPNGVYLYRITYRTTGGIGIEEGQEIELIGHITLLR